MTDRPAYLLVFEIEPITPFATYTTIPLHCTLMPWFRVSDEAALHTMLETVFDAAEPITLIAEGADSFGPLDGSYTVAVNHIHKTPTLMQLHMTLYGELEKLGAAFDEPAFCGEAFEPHVTECMGLQFVEGSRHHARRVHLIETLAADHLAQAPKRIVTTFVLSPDTVSTPV